MHCRTTVRTALSNSVLTIASLVFADRCGAFPCKRRSR